MYLLRKKRGVRRGLQTVWSGADFPDRPPHPTTGSPGLQKEANGFVYCVSSLGVTGTRTQITTDIGAMVKLVKAAKDIPCAVGFGISTPEQAKKMAAQSDGAIVGSAIVKICAAHGENCVPYVKDYVKSMKDAVREA